MGDSDAHKAWLKFIQETGYAHKDKYGQWSIDSDWVDDLWDTDEPETKDHFDDEDFTI